MKVHGKKTGVGGALREPTPERGLEESDVALRKAMGLVNAAVDAQSRSVKAIIHDNVFTFFNLIFVVLAVLVALVGSYRSLTFMPIVVLNTLIGIVQEVRSKRTLEKLTMLNAPTARVLRGGREQTLRAEELVLDDVVIFTAGNQICADGVVLEGDAQVNEALLTGEADEIAKGPGEKLMSGSFIVSGVCKARLTAVGADSYISRLTLEAKKSKGVGQSKMILALNRLIKAVGLIIIPIGVILFLHQWLLVGNTVEESVVGMVAALIGMIPEGLYLLASVALVISVMRLARSKVLVHEMNCIEMLARVDVLCVDKTGTITEPEMRVEGAVPLSDEGDILPLLGDFAAAQASDNITMEAVKAYFTQGQGRRPLGVTSFSAACKYSSATFEEGCYVLGAPEFVLRERFSEYQALIQSHAERGARVLVFARYDGRADGRALTAGVRPLCLVLLRNPIRKAAAQTFGYFAKQGVQVKVISGDNPVTVSRVAMQAHIMGAENYVDASTLQTEEALCNAATRYTVFGRVTPAQKRALVRALKSAGHTVAMTGDGVNDVLALKDADCSVAMASGSDAAAQAAQLVLLDNDFARMPLVVDEGRRVVNNIERSASLFLVKNIFSFLMSFFSIVLMCTYPVGPAQISLISAFTIGAPAFLLALEPNKRRIKGTFLRNVIERAFPAGVTDFILVSILMLVGRWMGIPDEMISTAATILMSVVGLLIICYIGRPMNLWRWAIVAAMVAGIALSATYFHWLFDMSRLSLHCTVLLLILCALALPVMLGLGRATQTMVDFSFRMARQFLRRCKGLGARRRKEEGR